MERQIPGLLPTDGKFTKISLLVLRMQSFTTPIFLELRKEIINLFKVQAQIHGQLVKLWKHIKLPTTSVNFLNSSTRDLHVCHVFHTGNALALAVRKGAVGWTRR
jgi:hypothetical protein